MIVPIKCYLRLHGNGWTGTGGQAPLRGRQAEAARNDAAILEAARAVFLRDSSAPMSAVAARAGVGVAGLYRRFAGKDELLRSLCGDGLRHFVALAEEARTDQATRGRHWSDSWPRSWSPTCTA